MMEASVALVNKVIIEQPKYRRFWEEEKGNWKGYDSPVLDLQGTKVLNRDDSGTIPVVGVLGDSHANHVAPRFNKLFEDAKRQEKPFPMVLFRTRDANPPLSCRDKHADDLAFILSKKPKVILYSTNWPQFIRPGDKSGNHGPNPKCCNSYMDDCGEYQTWEDADRLLSTFQDEIAGLVKAGIKVFVATINPEGAEFDPRKMVNGNAVIAPPVRLSAFRKQHEKLLSKIESAVKDAGATLIDYSDNQCWDDLCDPIAMREGYPIMTDKDHFLPFMVRYYLHVIDQVVEAAYE